MTVDDPVDPGDISFASVSTAMTGVVAALHGACFDDPWDEASMEATLAMPGVFGKLAVAPGDDPVGLVLCRTAADECEILTIGVRPGRRGRGVAKALLEKAMVCARARGARKMFLEVGESNVPAVGLYRTCGFSPVGRRPGYYRDSEGRRETAVIMARTLDLRA